MTLHTTASLDEALDYARSAVGHKATARLVRAAVFADGIEDTRRLAPQLAEVLVQAVGRRLTGDSELPRA